MRVKHKVVLKIGDDTALKDKLFDLDETLAEVVSDGFLRQSSGKLNIAAAASELLPFGDVDVVKAAYLKVDQEATIKINGSADAIQLRKADTTTPGTTAKFFIEADISSIEVTAPAGADLNGIYCVYGDPAP